MNHIIYFVSVDGYEKISPYEMRSEYMKRTIYLNTDKKNPSFKTLKIHRIRCSRLRIYRFDKYNHAIFAIKL